MPRQASMKGERRLAGLGLAAFLVAGGIAHASRMALPIDYNVLKSELIVEAKEIGKGDRVSVERVFSGPAKPSDTIVVEGLAEVEHRVYERAGRPTRKKRRSFKGAKALLFLIRSKDGRNWRLFDNVFALRWIVGGQVYLWQPIVMTPGPYAFLRDRAVRDVDELYQAIEKGLEKRARFQATLQHEDAKQKTKGLLEFIDPKEHDAYVGEAVRQLAPLGPAVADTLREQLTLPDQIRSRRRRILFAMGRLKDKGSVPCLLEIAAKSKRLLEKGEAPFDKRKAPPEEQEAYLDWTAAIDALERIGHARALPPFREALLWAVKRRDRHMVFIASHALGSCRARENLATFKKALELCPRRDPEGFGYDAANHMIRFLARHEFPETVPILAAQLDHPWGENQKLAHKGLTRIVGKDLGPQKAPWLEWYDRKGDK